VSQWLINNLWEIILLIIGCIFGLIKFNYTLFNRVIKTEIENNNLKLKSEIKNDFEEKIERQIRHEVRNQIALDKTRDN
jgi:hypothetical protein